MTGLDTSQTLTDQAILGGEKLRSHPHLEGHPYAGQDQAEPVQPTSPAQDPAAQEPPVEDVEAAAGHP